MAVLLDYYIIHPKIEVCETSGDCETPERKIRVSYLKFWYDVYRGVVYTCHVFITPYRGPRTS